MPIGDAPMRSFQQRVRDEKDELDSKLARLDEFRTQAVYRALPVDEQNRLTEQAELMRQYSDVLRRRIEAFTPLRSYK
jgi:hypothetical protein